jgi:hypothetical protein
VRINVRRAIRHTAIFASNHDSAGLRAAVRIPGLSFSWKRATGISAAKARISRATGIPLTREGRERKIGRAVLSLLTLLIRRR